MLVSVCIPEYNAEKYIRQNLDSILDQTYPEIEIILADDASSDQTAAIMREYAEKYPDRITALYSDVNRGSGATRNRTLSHAKGKYIFFSDCDDRLTPDCIETLMEKAAKENYPDIVIDGFKREDTEENLLYKRIYKSLDEAVYQSVPLFAKIVKRSFLNDNGIVSPEAWFEDVLWQARVFPLEPSVAMIDNCGYVYIQNTASLSHTKLKGFYKNDADKGFRYLAESYSRLDSDEKKTKMMYFILQYTAWYMLKSGTGIGGKSTVQEYKRVRSLLEQYFPQYMKLIYISLTRPKGTRKIVRWTIMGLVILMKLHLATPFFYLYGTFDLSRFWPSL